jgi:hypothetical protein
MKGDEMKAIYTKKAASDFIKRKDINGLILMWEREKLVNEVPCCEFYLKELNPRQIETLKEQTIKGKRFGLTKPDYIENLMDFLGLNKRKCASSDYPF